MASPAPTSNADVAAVFSEMGDLLAIQGGDPYRSRAFRNTARVIESLKTPLKELLLLRRLTSIRGIGSGSVERIQQILQTGTCADHQRLLSRLPTGLREVLHVRGMGPRHTRLAFEMLGISNREQLEWAAKNGFLRSLPGVGDKTVERILAHLDELREGPPPRLLLADGLAIGGALVDWMKEDPASVRVEQTGSARRRKETIGDMDILVGTSQPRLVAERFTAYPLVKTILLAGDSRVSVVLENRMQADLRCVSVESFGAGLHYFTGSQQHNIHLRMRANDRGLAISEHGVYERKLFGRGQGDENRKIARKISSGTHEHEIFSAVGLPFIVPEIREAEGEIDAAEAGRLPRLIELADLRGDLRLMAHSSSEAADLLVAGKARGHDYGCWVKPALDVADKAAAQAFVRAARQLEDRLQIRVFCGVSVLVDSSGSVDLDEEVRRTVDVVTGIAHGLHGTLDLDKQAHTERLVRVVSSGRIDVLAHTTGRRLLEEGGAGAELELHPVLLAAARHRVAVEVSGDPARLDLDARGCRADREVGALLSLTSAATRVDETTRLQQAVWQARRGWVEDALVLNAQRRSVVEAWVSERRPGRVTSERGTRLSGWVQAAVVDADAEANDVAAVVAPEDAELDAALRQRPLTTSTRERLEGFLAGDEDPRLRRALEVDDANALQRAFEILFDAHKKT